jgi:phosphoribosylformylglycinamidine synthase
MLGIVDSRKKIRNQRYGAGESIFILGKTKDELGGSEYFEYCLDVVGGVVPQINLEEVKETIRALHSLQKENLVEAIHDCSKGGLIVTVLEMAIQSDIGFTIFANQIPDSCSRLDYLFFSESHNRFIFTTRDSNRVSKLLANSKVTFSEIGLTTKKKRCIIREKKNDVLNLSLERVSKIYESSLEKKFEHAL